MDVSGKRAVVTGGGRGIGRGISLALARNGADVVVADIVVENAESVADEVRGLGRRALALAVDVTSQDSADDMASKAIAEFGAIDILVNNAGVIGSGGWEERDMPNEDDWTLIYEVNLRGVARVTDAVAPHMIERRQGKIVNIASIAGRRGSNRNPPYNASKAGVISLTQSQAQMLAPHNINVNAICPGLLWTPMWQRIASRQTMTPNPEEKTPRELFVEYVERDTPLGREQTPDDIGNLAAFLASEAAMNITGQSINVDGGLTMN